LSASGPARYVFATASIGSLQPVIHDMQQFAIPDTKLRIGQSLFISSGMARLRFHCAYCG
jgi:hypothetical protein